MIKDFPNDVHNQFASLILAALSRPLRYENGETSLEYDIVERLWHQLCRFLANEADIRLYESALKRMHLLGCDENETRCFEWWSLFWVNIILKTPDVAADYIEYFFADIFERNELTLAGLLHVNGLIIFSID